MTPRDVVEEVSAFRTAFRDWVKDYAARRREALQMGQVPVPAETDFRNWSARYFSQRAEAIDADSREVSRLVLGAVG
jgi:hypothetical protein